MNIIINGTLKTLLTYFKMTAIVFLSLCSFFPVAQATHVITAPASGTHGSNLITPNMDLVINKLKSGSYSVGDTVTFDFRNTTIASGNLSYLYVQVSSDKTINPNYITSNPTQSASTLCRHFSNSKFSFSCKLSISGQYRLTLDISGNATTYYSPLLGFTAKLPKDSKAFYNVAFQFTVNPNPAIVNDIPPTADLIVPTGASTYETLMLEATGSYDLDGTIKKYEWSVGAEEGQIRTISGNSGSQTFVNTVTTLPYHAFYLTQPGKYRASVLVTDDVGVSSSTTKFFTLSKRGGVTTTTPKATAILSLYRGVLSAGRQVNLDGIASFGYLRSRIVSFKFTYQLVDITTIPTLQMPNPDYLSANPSPSACKNKAPLGTVIPTFGYSKASYTFKTSEKGYVDIFLEITDTVGSKGNTCRRINVQ